MLRNSSAVVSCQAPIVLDRRKCSQPSREKRSRSRIAVPTARTVRPANTKGNANAVGAEPLIELSFQVIAGRDEVRSSARPGGFCEGYRQDAGWLEPAGRLGTRG